MRVWVDVYDAAGNRLGAGPVTTVISATVTRALDGAGSFNFSFPAADRRGLDLLQNERRVVINVQDAGGKRVLGGGIIRRRNLAYSDQQAVMQVRGPDLLDELKRRNTLLARIYDQERLEDVVDDLVALAGGWTAEVDPAIADDLVDGRFDGVSALKAVQKVVENYGLHLRADGRTLEISAFGEESGLRVVATKRVSRELLANPHVLQVESMQIGDESDDLVNWLLPVGSGEGEAALTLARSTRSVAGGFAYDIDSMTGPDGTTLYFLKDDDSITAFGEIQKVGTFKDVSPLSNAEGDVVNAANALYDAAVAYLQRHKEPQREYRLSVKSVKARIEPGQKIHIRYRGRVLKGNAPVDIIDENGDFWVMRVSEAISADSSSVELEVASIDRYQESVAEIIIGAIESIRLKNLKPAVSTAPRSYVYTREVAPGFPAVVPVELTAATLYLHKLRIRLRTMPFRATATGSEAGGTIDNMLLAVDAGAGPGAFSFTNRLYGFIGAGSQLHILQLQRQTGVTDGDLRANVTIAAHTHDLEYGISDDTEHPQNIEIWVNGVDRTSALGGPFAPSDAAIDIILDEGLMTEYILNAVGGFQQLHEVEIRAGAGQGRIEATVEIYETAQSIRVV